MSEPLTRFEAVWPVVDEDLLARPQQLLDEALDDLPRVAQRSRVQLDDTPVRMAVRPGRQVPGSGGARWVVHAVTTGRPLPARPYDARLAS